MSESEIPKEGDVILVPSGMPYFARKRPEPKKGVRKIAKKKKLSLRLEPGLHEGEEVFIAPDEEAEIEEWEREMIREEEFKAYKKSRRRVTKKVEDEPIFGKGEFGEEEGGEEGEEEGGEEGGGDEEEGEEEGEELEEEILEEEPEEKGTKARYQVQEEFFYKKVEIPAARREQAARLGISIPQYEIKLLPDKVRRRIAEKELKYPSYKRMRVGPDGELLPIVEPKPRSIEMYGEDLLPRPKIAYSPPKKELPKDNPYDQRYPFGAYVSFSDIPEGTETIKGTVLSYTEEGVNVSVAGRMHFVEYTNGSLKLTPRPKQKDISAGKKESTVEELLVSPDIPDMFRSMIIESYIKILKTIKEPFKPSKKVSIIDWELLKHPPLPWDEYYSREYQAWIFDRYRDQFVKDVDLKKVEGGAKKLVDQESNIDSNIEQITGILPDGLWYTTTINDVLKALKEQKNLTVFQAHLIRVLDQEIISGGGGFQEYVTKYIDVAIQKGVEEPERYYRRPGNPPIFRTSPRQSAVPGVVEKRPLSGRALAQVLTNAMESYQRTYQPDLEGARSIVMNIAIRDRFNAYEPTDDDRRIFESEHIVKLTEMHISAEKEYNEEKKKADAAQKEDTRIKELIEQSDVRLEDSVKRFEQLVYAAHGDTVHNYLSNALVPYIFLDGPIAPHAKFFRAKLANGSFEFSELTGANIAHYLPELGMNQNLTSEDWEKALDILGIILNNNITDLIELYIATHDPLSRIEHKSRLNRTFNLADSLIKMLKDPSDVCFKETGTGVRPVVRSGKYVYKSGTKEYLMEKIPPGEMTICYADGKFTCHEIVSILRAISVEDEPINPYTGRPYPAEFIAKMKERYADRLRGASLWEEFGEPEPSPPKPSPIKVKVPAKPKVIAKKTRVRHRPLKKAKGKIGKIALVGDYFDLLTSTDVQFNVYIKDPKGGAGELRTFEFTDNLEDPDVNVVVLGFDARDPESMLEIDVKVGEQLNNPKNQFVYAIGVEAEGVESLDRSKLTKRVKDRVIKVSTEKPKAAPKTVAKKSTKKTVSKISKLEHVFYADTVREEDLVEALTDVVIDVEALTVV